MTAKKPVYNGTHSKCFPAAEYCTQEQFVTFSLIYDKYHHCICQENKEKEKEMHRSVSLQVLRSNKELRGVAGRHQVEQQLAETQQHSLGTLLQQRHHDRDGHIHPPRVAVWQMTVSPNGQQHWPDTRGDHLVDLFPCQVPTTQQLSCLCILKLGSSHTIPCGPPHALQVRQAALPPTRTARAQSGFLLQLQIKVVWAVTAPIQLATPIQQLFKRSQFTWQTRSSPD